MRVSANQLEQALGQLPDPTTYHQPIINIRVPAENTARDTGASQGSDPVITFSRYPYLKKQRIVLSWSLVVI